MTITYFALYNCALMGAAAGMSSQKQALYESGYAENPVEPADSSALLTTSAAYATEVDLLLQTLTPSSFTNIIDMVADQLTVAPTSAALADASAYLPVVMALMSKSTMDGRGIPTDASGNAYTQTDWANSNLPNSVVANFLAFSGNVFVDGADTVKFVPLANVAMGAAMAGMLSGRQELYNASGNPLTYRDINVPVATATAFAMEVDAQLVAQETALGAGFPANITGLVSTFSPYSTMLPSTAVLTNALYTLVPAMGALCKAIFDGRGIPKDNNGVAFVQADYADIANTVVAQFIQYASGVQTT